jgi:O-antigen ligase
LRFTSNHLLIIVLFGIGLSLLFKGRIEEKFLVNPYTSTTSGSSLEEQALSITNITSDVSNMERINRWKCAWRMFVDKPLLGYGPGTYQFQYLPYQRDGDMTYISVTSPFVQISGRGGSAHSEYLLFLSEVGIVGLLSWLFFLVSFGIESFKNWNSKLGQKEKAIGLTASLGCFTYVIHGAFNNYLNITAFGVSFWILTAIVMYISTKRAEHES